MTIPLYNETGGFNKYDMPTHILAIFATLFCLKCEDLFNYHIDIEPLAKFDTRSVNKFMQRHHIVVPEQKEKLHLTA